MAESKNNDALQETDAPIPDAGGEPVKQATAPMARPVDPVLPPAPRDYEMPDEYQRDWLTQTREWVEANPALAVVAAAGLGLVVGRIVTALIPDPEPPSFADRVERRAKVLRKEAKSFGKDASAFADDAGEVLSKQLKRAAEALGDAAETIGDKAEAGYERGKDLADVAADAVKAAVAGVVAKKADSWIDRMRG